MFYINENIKMNKAYQSLPFSKKHTEMLMIETGKMVFSAFITPQVEVNFLNAKESVMKYFSSVVIGDIDPYLYHKDEW
jgi:hypothetical protein